jgi:hypothetical protein
LQRDKAATPGRRPLIISGPQRERIMKTKKSKIQFSQIAVDIITGEKSPIQPIDPADLKTEDDKIQLEKAFRPSYLKWINEDGEEKMQKILIAPTEKDYSDLKECGASEKDIKRATIEVTDDEGVKCIKAGDEAFLAMIHEKKRDKEKSSEKAKKAASNPRNRETWFDKLLQDILKKQQNWQVKEILAYLEEEERHNPLLPFTIYEVTDQEIIYIDWDKKKKIPIERIIKISSLDTIISKNRKKVAKKVLK